MTIKKITQTEQRMEIVKFFYHHFVMNYHLKQTKKFFLTKKEFNLYQKKVIHFIFDHFPKLIATIKDNLDKQWNFSEIANFDKALLLVIISEFYGTALPKKVAISEAVKLVQTFGNFSAYSYINKILEKILHSDHSLFLNK